MFTEYNKMEEDERNEKLRSNTLEFTEWIRANFRFDNFWEDIYNTIDSKVALFYSTEELYDWWFENVK